jgi:crossover junction endodeoxyribonuclease RuvC
MRILGLDPGTAATGFGIVAFTDGRLTLELCGVWRPPAGELARRLDFIASALQEVLDRERPAAVSVETVFAARNVSSALKLAHARGVLLAGAARACVPVFEYEPRLVKKALVGYGNAEKQQVRAMVLSLLSRQRSRIPLDAADALAVAICHVHSGR